MATGGGMSNRAVRARGEEGAALSTVRDLDLEPIRAAVEGVRYGEVRVIIQDGVIVQIERVEKQRLR